MTSSPSSFHDPESNELYEQKIRKVIAETVKNFNSLLGVSTFGQFSKADLDLRLITDMQFHGIFERMAYSIDFGTQIIKNSHRYDIELTPDCFTITSEEYHLGKVAPEFMYIDGELQKKSSLIATINNLKQVNNDAGIQPIPYYSHNGDLIGIMTADNSLTALFFGKHLRFYYKTDTLPESIEIEPKLTIFGCFDWNLSYLKRYYMMKDNYYILPQDAINKEIYTNQVYKTFIRVLLGNLLLQVDQQELNKIAQTIANYKAHHTDPYVWNLDNQLIIGLITNSKYHNFIKNSFDPNILHTSEQISSDNLLVYEIGIEQLTNDFEKILTNLTMSN